MTRSRSLPLLLAAALLAAALVTLGVVPVHAGQHSSARALAPVKTTSARVLVTPKGMTLYVFAADPKNKSTCYGTCAKYWPPRLVNGTPRAKLTGIPGTFGSIMRTDGTHQLTYDGAPLYTFAGDKAPGNMNGQGLLASGGYWWVVVAAGM